MKPRIYNCRWPVQILLMAMLSAPVFSATAQDSSAAPDEKPLPPRPKPVKRTFESVWIIDNQTVMVPVKGTLEMDIQHRFGTLDKGYEDFWGFFAPSNIRLGVSYSPINRLNLGLGITKENKIWDLSAKYAVITQTPGKYPLSVSYYGNAAFDTRKDPTITLVKADAIEELPIKHETDRLLFFHQLIIARKINEKFSVQVAPSLTHQNAVGGYYTKNDSTGKEVYQNMRHGHFAVAVAARYKITNVTSVIFNYDQPLTKHPVNNPNPNLSLGVEFNTSSHAFQLFVGNYYALNPQRNNLFNHNDPFSSGKPKYSPESVPRGYLIGFNITRLWNY